MADMLTRFEGSRRSGAPKDGQEGAGTDEARPTRGVLLYAVCKQTDRQTVVTTILERFFTRKYPFRLWELVATIHRHL